MKASRLLTLLLLLQTRQRMTTGELAARLEVSRRTVLRDVDALSVAGVPVYAERGRHGGIALLPGARLNASHLDPGEIDALSLTGLDHDQLERLGLAAASEQAGHKLTARQAQSADATVARLGDLILADNTSWMASSSSAVDLADLAMDLRVRRRLRIRYRRSGGTRAGSRVVDPYGLVVKSNRWYLIADARQDPRMFALERLASYEVLPERAILRTGETLASVWAKLRDEVERAGRVEVAVRLRRSRLDLAHRILGSRVTAARDLDGEWCHLTIRYDEVEAVRQLLQFGDHVEVLGPEQARRRIHELATDLADRHAWKTPRPG